MSRRLKFSTKILLLGLVCSSVSTEWAQSLRDLHFPRPAAPDAVLIVGVLGGFEPWNDKHRGVVKVARELQSLDLPGVYVATVENRRQNVGVQAIVKSIDHHEVPFRQPRVILYGQSWGGAAVVGTARKLQKSGIRVQLTIQVDSVGLRDNLIPRNVENAANLFQHDYLGVSGRTRIQVEDPFSTRILENTRHFYWFHPYDSLSRRDGSWVRRTFGGSHAKMELDESIWAHVKDLILAAVQNQL